MKFTLKMEAITVRDQTVKVRELTQSERVRWVKESSEDRFRGPALLISLGAVEPPITEKEAGDFPGDVVEALVGKIMSLSGMKTAKEEKPGQKEPVAG